MEAATPGDERETSERHELPDEVSAAGLARDKARRFVGRLRMEAVVEPLTLIVSELVSNAVRHGKTTHPAPAATGRPGSARGRPR
jgi:anti-sigma regulatory factor (Ser/Thr protein kinase)